MERTLKPEKIRPGRYAYREFIISRRSPNPKNGEWEIMNALDGQLVSSGWKTLAAALGQIDRDGEDPEEEKNPRCPRTAPLDVKPKPTLLADILEMTQGP